MTKQYLRRQPKNLVLKGYLVARTMERIPIPCLMFVTDRTLLTPNWTLAQAVAPAVTGGANIVLLRENDLPKGPRLSVAKFLSDGIRGRVPMLVYGDPEFAIESGADGVVVDEAGQAAEAREKIGPKRILGALMASPDSITRVETIADFGLLNLEWSEPDFAIAIIRRFRERSELPLVAGIDPPPDSVKSCLEAGASGVAICEAGMAAYNRTEAVGRAAAELGLELAVKDRI